MGTIIIVVTAAVATAKQWYRAYWLTYALSNAFFCICVFMVLVCIWVCHLYNGESFHLINLSFRASSPLSWYLHPPPSVIRSSLVGIIVWYCCLIGSAASTRGPVDGFHCSPREQSNRGDCRAGGRVGAGFYFWGYTIRTLHHTLSLVTLFALFMGWQICRFAFLFFFDWCTTLFNTNAEKCRLH